LELQDNANITMAQNNPRGGLDLHFDLRYPMPVQQSETWSTAGWNIRFLALRADTQINLSKGNYFAKVIVGELIHPKRHCLGEPFTVRSTRLDDSLLIASQAGCLLALMERTTKCPDNLHDVTTMTWHGVAAEHLAWQSFADKFAGMTDVFDGLDCYMATGFHLLDYEGSEIAYLNPWCCGKGVDLTTHNHGHPPSPQSPAFAEIHWVFNNGTGEGGMFETAEPGASERVRHRLMAGDEHGPYFAIDLAGKPVRRDNGAVKYPWHGWQGGTNDSDMQAYDYVAAFEINPEYI